MPSLQDEKARYRALTALGQTLLVEAGAGAGKTGLLSGRVIMLLLEGVKPDSIVAITFTRAAASELEERIAKTIKELLSGKISEVLALALPQGLSEHQVDNLKRAQQNMGAMTCTTIHGFCLELIRPYPIESQIDPGASILDPADAERIYAEHLNEWLNKLFESPAEARSIAGEETLDFSRSLFGSIIRRDRETGLKEILRIASILKEYRTFHVPLSADLDIAIQALADAVRAYSQWHDAMPFQEEATREEIHDLLKLVERIHESDPAGHHEALAARLFAPYPKACKKGQVEFKLYRCKGKWKASAKAAGRLETEALAANDRATFLRQQCQQTFLDYQDTLLQHTKHAMVESFRSLVEIYNNYKTDTARLDFDDLLEMASNLLLRHPTIRGSLAERYRHILVDEFQDTDPIQARILWLLAGEGHIETTDQWNQLSIRPGQLFLVGDPKQAIYRFRGADLHTYLRAKQALAQISSNAILEITTNFRSVKGIIDYVNHAFEEPFSEEDQPDLVHLVAHQESTRNGHVATFGVQVGPPESENEQPPASGGDQEQTKTSGRKKKVESAHIREAEAAKVAEVVKGLLDQHQPRDIVLLAPTGTGLWIYEQALEELGVPTISQAGKGFFGRQEIKDLIAILRVLNNEKDTLALGALLRSPLVGLTEQNLADAVMELDVSERRKGVRIGRDPVHHQHPVLRSTLESLNHLLPLRHALSPFALLSEAVERLQVLPVLRLRDPQNAARLIANVERFLTMSMNYNLTGLDAFTQEVWRQWEEEGRQEEAMPITNAVAIHTIHASKGLEWDVVIPINTATRLDTRADCVADHNDRTITFRCFGRTTRGHEERLERERLEKMREGARLWYVALTRAREQLLLPKLDTREDGDWFSLINLPLESLEEWKPSRRRKTALNPIESPVEAVNQQDDPTWEEECKIVGSLVEETVWYNPSQQHETRTGPSDTDRAETVEPGHKPGFRGSPLRGTLLHKLMEERITGELGFVRKDIEERAVVLIRQSGIEDHSDPAQGISSRELALTVEKTCQLEAVKAYWHQLIAEYPIYINRKLEDNKHTLVSGIADAVAVDEDGHALCIIDWKSDIQPDSVRTQGYERQVRAYMQATGAASGLIVYMSTGQIIEVGEQNTTI